MSRGLTLSAHSTILNYVDVYDLLFWDKDAKYHALPCVMEQTKIWVPRYN